jgi:D-alanyl-D-alanine carboxypeptidase
MILRRNRRRRASSHGFGYATYYGDNNRKENPMHRTRATCLAIAIAALFACLSPAYAATPLCAATPPPETTAYAAHVQEVNRGLGIPPDYAARHNLRLQPEAKDLVQVPRDVYGRKVEMVAPAAAALKTMFAAAARDGIKLETVSGFRSIAYQVHLVRLKLQRGMGIEQALKINAVPGYSEHQTGCAVDLTTPGVPAADGSFANSRAFTWLQQHGATYGFSLSFPPGNKYGYEYEPWHWRYTAGTATGR